MQEAQAPHLAGAFGDADDAVALLPEQLGHVRQHAVWAMHVKLHLRDKAHVHAA